MSEETRVDLRRLIEDCGSEEQKGQFEELIRLEMHWIQTGSEESFHSWQELTEKLYTAFRSHQGYEAQ